MPGQGVALAGSASDTGIRVKKSARLVGSARRRRIDPFFDDAAGIEQRRSSRASRALRQKPPADRAAPERDDEVPAPVSQRAHLCAARGGPYHGVDGSLGRHQRHHRRRRHQCGDRVRSGGQSRRGDGRGAQNAVAPGDGAARGKTHRPARRGDCARRHRRPPVRRQGAGGSKVDQSEEPADAGGGVNGRIRSRRKTFRAGCARFAARRPGFDGVFEHSGDIWPGDRSRGRDWRGDRNRSDQRHALRGAGSDDPAAAAHERIWALAYRGDPDSRSRGVRLWRLHSAFSPERNVHGRGWTGGGRHSGGPARDHHRHSRDGRAPNGYSQRDREAPAGGGDARFGLDNLHRQDGNADTQ